MRFVEGKISERIQLRPTDLEVKSGRRKERFIGMEAFSKAFQVKRQLLVGNQGIPVEEFLLTPIEHWLS